MAEQYELLRYTEYAERFVWRSETEKFYNNLEMLRTASEAMAEKTHELNMLFEEIQFNLGHMRAIRIKLNQTAVQMGLQPLSETKRKL